MDSRTGNGRSYRKLKGLVMSKLWKVFAIVLLLACTPALAKDSLRILTWDGYVTREDLASVNALLSQSGYDIEATVIAPYAEGAEQMYQLMRKGKVDISFLTLFFIKMQGEKSASLIQPINLASPRLSNYKHLLPSLTKLEMGMRDGNPLYIPFSGGSYGFYVDRKKVSATEVPKSWGDLFSPRWQGKYSLNQSQIWYNVAIASMALGKQPYYLNSLADDAQRQSVIKETQADGPLAKKLMALYENAGDFWDAAPRFLPHLEIVSSWGMDVKQANRDGGDWQLITFKEGNLVWMDTINFASGLTGKRLEAAEIVANYFIGKEVQSRVASELSLVSVSTLASTNPLLSNNPQFFTSGSFVPPYNRMADNRMRQMSSDVLKKIVVSKKRLLHGD